MSFTVSDLIAETLHQAGVRRIYGLPGDSLNGFTDALRRNGVWLTSPDEKGLVLMQSNGMAA